ncbi:MAG: hypothetical protein ABWZ78_04040 [Burkholderiaceae bacterium]
MREALTRSRLLALFAAGWIAFDFPLLALWDRVVTVFGVPLLPLALFAIWALLIAAVAWVLERDTVDGGTGADDEDDFAADAGTDAGAAIDASAAADAGAAIDVRAAADGGAEPQARIDADGDHPGRRR